MTHGLGDLLMIDLSGAMEHEGPGELETPGVEYIKPQGAGLETMRCVFGCEASDLVYSNGQGWAVENLTASSHCGTHVDAPYHYGATSGGKPARRIDEVPLEWCFAPGVVIDMRHKSSGDLIAVEDLQRALQRIDYTLKPLDIALIHTGVDKRWGSRDYFLQPGLGRESTLWLVE